MQTFDIKGQIGTRIRLLRRKLGLTQRQLNEATGIDAQQISRYERGINEARKEQLAKIAEYANVPLDYFYVKEDVVSPYEIKTPPQNLLDDVREILENRDKDIIDALTANIKAFIKAVRPSEDRRKSHRVKLSVPADIRIAGQQQDHQGKVLDASHVGLLIQSDCDIEVGKKIDINISFTKKDINENFRAKGEVVWKNKQSHNNNECWRYGVKFSDVLDGGHEKLSSLFQK